MWEPPDMSDLKLAVVLRVTAGLLEEYGEERLARDPQDFEDALHLMSIRDSARVAGRSLLRIAGDVNERLPETYRSEIND